MPVVECDEDTCINNIEGSPDPFNSVKKRYCNASKITIKQNGACCCQECITLKYRSKS